MNNQEADFETAIDESIERSEREDAINELRTGNACDRLAELATMDDLGQEFRELAVEKLATPQCKPKLESLLESGDLPDSLHQQAETMLEDTPDDTGAGP